MCEECGLFRTGNGLRTEGVMCEECGLFRTGNKGLRTEGMRVVSHWQLDFVVPRLVLRILPCPPELACVAIHLGVE